MQFSPLAISEKSEIPRIAMRMFPGSALFFLCLEARRAFPPWMLQTPPVLSAACAEESASASEEIAAQAQTLSSFASELERIVSGAAAQKR